MYAASITWIDTSVVESEVQDDFMIHYENSEFTTTVLPERGLLRGN